LRKKYVRGLSLAKESVSFTREGAFYVANKPKMSALVGAAYVVMLGLLLIAFLGMRIYIDLKSGNVVFGVIDLILAVSILLFFGAYSSSSVSFFSFLDLIRGKKNGT